MISDGILKFFQGLLGSLSFLIDDCYGLHEFQ